MGRDLRGVCVCVRERISRCERSVRGLRDHCPLYSSLFDFASVFLTSIEQPLASNQDLNLKFNSVQGKLQESLETREKLISENSTLKNRLNALEEQSTNLASAYKKISVENRERERLAEENAAKWEGEREVLVEQVGFKMGG